MFEFKHPKYYKELRKRNNLDQAISDEASTEATSVRPGPGLKLPGPRPISNANKGLIHRRQASSSKLRYTPTGILLGVDLGDKPQASSKPKPEPSSGSEDI